jgi:sialidase-1
MTETASAFRQDIRQRQYPHIVFNCRTILKEPRYYLAWPTIAKGRSGELLVAFSGNRQYHACPWGKTQLIRSSDNGKTWMEPYTINDTPLDDRDAGLTATASGSLLLTWFTSLAFEDERWMRHVFADRNKRIEVMNSWREHRKSISDVDRGKWLGSWLRRSTDNGRSFGRPVRLPVSCPHGTVQMRDKRILMAGKDLYGNHSNSVSSRLDHSAMGLGNIEIIESQDDGCSWRKLSTIPLAESFRSASEPHLVETLTGKLIVFMRFETYIQCPCMLFSESYDGGVSWPEGKLSNILGFPPHLLCLHDGRLLLTYSCRHLPFGQYATVSNDNGLSWAPPFLISSAPNDDHGYPTSVQLDDESIVTVYYESSQFREKCELKMVHWRLLA